MRNSKYFCFFLEVKTISSKDLLNKHLDRANQNVHISCTMYKYCWQVLDNSCMLYELVNNQVYTMYICTCFEITFFFSCKLKYLLTYLHSLQDTYILRRYMYVQCRVFHCAKSLKYQSTCIPNEQSCQNIHMIKIIANLNNVQGFPNSKMCYLVIYSSKLKNYLKFGTLLNFLIPKPYK